VIVFLTRLPQGPEYPQVFTPYPFYFGVWIVSLTGHRIFIATIITERGIVKKWEELVQYALSLGNPREPRQQSGLPTLNGYNLMVIELRDLLIKVSREDLGIE
jgi:hypothetical protein